MLNRQLYDLLESRFGPGRIESEGVPGSFLPAVGSQAGKRMSISDWGELYCFRCPRCEDTDKRRLVFSHLCGAYAKVGGAARPVRFSPYAFRCRHEGCHGNREFVKQYIEPMRLWTMPETDLSDAGQPLRRTHSLFLGAAATMPKPSIPIISTAVPEAVVDYLVGDRGFDLDTLYREHMVHWVPQGARWDYPVVEGRDPRDPLDFHIDRILCPIASRRRLVGWQARVVGDATGDSAKYLTMPGIQTRQVLYNGDMAKHFDQVVVCEGVTDVWRVGEQTVALFGKELSDEQIALMRHYWSFGECACYVMLDPDVSDKAAETCEALRGSGIFAAGVHLVSLPEGRDPANCSEHELEAAMAEAVAI